MADPTPDHLRGATIAVTGASGNVGTALLRRLTDPAHGTAAVRGLARRQPPDVAPYTGARWYLTDLGEPASEEVLAELLEGADAVVHLAWALQPGRHPEQLHRVNVEGTRRVMRAALAAGVRHVVHMSSVGAYAAGAPGRQVREDWPVSGIPSSQYSRQKSDAERIVRQVLGRQTDIPVAVTRPTLVLQPEAASEIGRYFLGPLALAGVRLVPGSVARHLLLPMPDLHLGFVHADDVAEVITRILQRRLGGPFNIAAEPYLSSDEIARALGVRRVPVPASVTRAALQAAFLAHVVPTEPGWLDLGIGSPGLDTDRARTLLDWTPAHRGDEVLAQFVAALGRGEGAPGPLLRPAGGPTRTPADDAADVPR